MYRPHSIRHGPGPRRSSSSTPNVIAWHRPSRDTPSLRDLEPAADPAPDGAQLLACPARGGLGLLARPARGGLGLVDGPVRGRLGLPAHPAGLVAHPVRGGVPLLPEAELHRLPERGGACLDDSALVDEEVQELVLPASVCVVLVWGAAAFGVRVLVVDESAGLVVEALVHRVAGRRLALLKDAAVAAVEDPGGAEVGLPARGDRVLGREACRACGHPLERLALRDRAGQQRSALLLEQVLGAARAAAGAGARTAGEHPGRCR